MSNTGNQEIQGMTSVSAGNVVEAEGFEGKRIVGSGTRLGAGGANKGRRGIMAAARSTAVKVWGAAAMAVGLLGAGGEAAAGPNDVALLHTMTLAEAQDVQAKLTALGEFGSIDIISAETATPSLSTLQNYGGVLVFQNAPYFDGAALGSVLVSYFNSGGGVVCAMAETTGYDPMLGGWEGFRAINRGLYDYYSGPASLGTFDENHSIMAGVNSFTSQSRPTAGVVSDPSVTLVASYATGDPLAATRLINGRHIVDLGFYASTFDASSFGWDPNTDGARLMANSLMFAMGNMAPVAIDDGYSMAEDGGLTAFDSVLDNDTDAESDFTTAAIVVGSEPAGAISFNLDGSFNYTPVQDFAGNDTFQYQAYDEFDVSNIATVTITVNPVNDPPIARRDDYTVIEDTPLAMYIFGNDSDVDGPGYYISIVTQPEHGTLVDNCCGTFTYTPDADYVGADTFRYQYTDGTDSDQANVFITVTPVNDAPQARNDVYVTGEEQELNVPVEIGVLDNDSDVDAGDTMIAKLNTTPAHGEVTLNTDGSFTYTPDANYTGPDTFTYKALDAVNAQDIARVTINVGFSNDAPVALDDAYSTDEDTTLTVVAANGVLANDSDPDGETTTASLVTNPAHGTVTLNQSGRFTYVPGQNYVGTDSFTYQAFDQLGMSQVAKVTITVGGVNDSVVAQDDFYSVVEDTELTIAASGVLGNDSDPDDGDTLQATLITPAANGNVALNPDGSFTYMPNENFNSVYFDIFGSSFDPAGNPDSFVYEVNDGNGGTAQATVTIVVSSVVDQPVAVDDNYTLVEDSSLTPDSIPVSLLANDTFEFNPLLLLGGIGGPIGPLGLAAEQGEATEVGASNGPIVGTVLSFVALQDPPDHGEITLYDDPMGAFFGFFNYIPDPDFSGTDSFTYVIFQIDPISGQFFVSNTATVTLNVTPENDAPVAERDVYNMAEDQVLNISARGVLVNDTDADGDTMSAVLKSIPANGTLAFPGDGSFVYTPESNFNGFDTFTYQADDGSSVSNVTTVRINVATVPDAPIAADDTYTVNEDTTITVAAIGVLSNDTDVEGGSTLSAGLISGPTSGTLVFPGDGGFEYRGYPGFHGTDSFTYYTADGTNDSEPATVFITVNPVQDAPVASENSYATPEDTQLSVGSPGVLADDSDADGDTMRAVLQSSSLGALSLNENGSFTYTPVADFVGTDMFTYVAADATSQSAVTTVTIVVGGTNDAPIGRADVYNVGVEDEELFINAPGVLANDDDSDNTPAELSAVLITGPSNGTLTLNSDGSFSYDPFRHFNGTDTFTYQVTDGELESEVVTVTLIIAADNDRPRANDDFYSTAEDTPLYIAPAGVLANDRDADGDTLTASLINSPFHGTVALNPDGSFTYTPEANYNSDIDGGWADEFVYEVSDGNGGTREAYVLIYVSSVVDTPVASNDSYIVKEDGSVSGYLLDNDLYEEGFGGQFGGPEAVGSGDTLIPGVGFIYIDIVDPPDHGEVVVDDDGFFTYTPDPDFSGTDSFQYVLIHEDFFNNISFSNPATVTFFVTSSNDAPVAVADTFSTPEDTPLVVAATGVLANDLDVDNDDLEAILQDNPQHGILSLSGTGNFTYTPNADFAGTDMFTYFADDGSSVSEITTATITVTPVNDAPVAFDDTFSLDEDTTLTIFAPGVLQNDTDVDDTVITATVVTQPLYGTVVVFPNGAIRYVPDANYFGTDSFTYRAHDGDAGSNIATVSLTILAVPDAPIGNEDNYGTNEDVTLTVNDPGVLADDVDVDGDSLTATIVSGPSSGLLSLNVGGGFTYEPAAGYFGEVTFFYQAHDGLLSSEPTTVTITIGEVNDPPVAQDDEYSVYEDTVTSVPAPGVLANDFDAEDDILSATLIAGASHGVVTLETSGSFTYTPNPNYTGPDSFSYQANDGVSDSNVATVIINVEPLNDSPLANEDYYSTDEEQPITVAAPGVLGNDFDDDEDTILTALLRDNPLHGVLDLNGDGSFTYTPDSGFFGEDVFTYNANDGSTNSLHTTVTIFVRAQNDAPIAVEDTYIADEDTSLTVAAPGLLANDTDDDDDVLSASLVVQPLHGEVFLNEDGSFNYLAYPDFHGVDSFIYRATDGLQNSTPVTVTITVRDAPDAPMANPDNYGTQESTDLVIGAPGVLGNDTDLDGDTLTAVMGVNAPNGSVTLEEDGSFVYSPTPGFNGIDQFTYLVNDGSVNSDLTTVTITVGPVNGSPVANDDVYNVFEDQVTSITAPGVLSNDFDSDDVILSATLVTSPLYGTLVLEEDGGFEYEPFGNFNGQDSFTYQAYDGVADSNVATVILNVVPVDDPPLANPDNYSTNEEQPITVATPGVLGNDSDSDGTALNALLEDNPLNGTVDLNGDGSFTYTPANGFSGIDRFTYRANDGSSNSDKTTVTIAVLPANDSPVANADTFIVAEDTTLTIVAPGVMQNDTDDDGDITSASVVVPPLHGTLELAADGGFVYAPNPNYSGDDEFTYRLSDGFSASNDAVVSITVTPVQDVPTANPDNYSTQENVAIIIPAPGVLADDVDLDGDTLSAIPVDYPVAGVLTLLEDGSFEYIPNTNFEGEDTFTYQASDTFSVSNITTVTIAVGPVNDAPVANDDFYNVFEDIATTISAPGVLANDTDTDNTTLTAVLINGPLNGTVELNDDGSFTYTPFENYTGLDTFTYQANDDMADSNVATVTINVVPVDDVPLANEDFYVVDEDQFITVAAPGVLGNDSDSDGTTLTALLQQEPPHGIVSLNGDGSFTYTPDLGYYGNDYFVYQANDGVSNSLPTTATIVVRPRNDTPVSVEDIYNAVEDTPLVKSAVDGVLANDSDPDGDGLTATVVNQPLNGVVALAVDGSFTYTPAPNFNGEDYFIYRASDGVGNGTPTKVTINVAPVQDVPVANDDAYSTLEDTPITVPAPGVLGDDTDADGETLSALLVDAPINGLVTLNADGSFTYTPATGFDGIDFFTYEAYDGTEESNIAEVTITVGFVNDVPVANPDTYRLFEDTTSNIPAPGVLQNDTDGDGDLLTAAEITGPLYGTLTLNPDGSFAYTPAPDFNGVDYFTYQAFDGISESNVTTVTLNIVPRSDVPLANEDFYSTTEELELVVAAPGVLGNDFDADNQVLISLLEDNPLNGTVGLAGDGSFIYVPDAGFTGTDFFTYRAHDGTQNSDKTTVTITVIPRNDVPVGVDDIYNAVEDTPLVKDATDGVLANDYDLDGDALTAVLINQPLNGSVALSADGSFTYTPNSNFNGQDYFIYRAYDGFAFSNPPSKVVINVAPVQDKPVGVADMYSIPEDKVLTVVAPGILGNDSDADGETLTAILVDAPGEGIIQLNATGGFSYTPDEDFFGIDTFTYFANDGTENSDLTTVTISVGGRNDGPVAVDDTYFTGEDVPLSIPAPGVLGNDTDDDGEMLQAVIITPPVQGTLVLNADGSFDYTPNPSYTGPDSFVYRASDGTTLSNPATVSITVTPINDAPVLSNVNVTPSLNENSVAVLTADLFDADLTDTFLVSVNWGDGAAPSIVAYPAGTSRIFLTHQFLDDNPTGTSVDTNTVVVTVQDNNGGADTETRNVVVSNLTPNLENVVLTQTIPTGGQARLQGTITDIGTQDTFLLTVNWGDGNVETFNHGPGASGFDIIHTYAVPGMYTVTVTVQDDDGGILTITPGILVRNTADLALIKTANPDPASVGELVTYSMIVSNHGPDIARNVILMDTLPSNVEIISSTLNYVPADGVLNWFLGDLPDGQTVRVDLVVKTRQQGPITNFAAVLSEELDPNEVNNMAAITTTIGWLPDGPDLMAEAVMVNTFCKTNKKGIAKCKAKISILVANRGTERANKSIYSVYLSDDAIFAPHQDMKLKTKKFPVMDPGQSRGQNQTIKLPNGYTTTGKYIIVVLDEGNLVFEGNETNNLVVYGPMP